MMKPKYQTWVIWFGMLLWQGAAAEAEILPYVKVREPTDLQAVGQEARQHQLPLLIMFSRQGCPYCDVVREEFLKPMLRSGDYTQRVVILEIHTDSYAQLRDFDGQMITTEALARRYRASFAPTVVFLDHQGKELVERLIGITTRDFYGGFLDEAIEQALLRLRNLGLQQQVKLPAS